MLSGYIHSAWPQDFIEQLDISQSELDQLNRYEINSLADRLDLDLAVARELFALYLPAAGWLLRQRIPDCGTAIVGINGAQGTGKSTAAAVLADILALFGKSVCTISIDDIYLRRSERESLANRVHPLLSTRGVPGTHDLQLGMQLLDQLRAADKNTNTAIPRFDKAKDDRHAPENCSNHHGAADYILFEGWCVAAVPQAEQELEKPINTLESSEDKEGIWRRYVNQELAVYQSLYEKINFLLMLQAPSFECVYEWRYLQEEKLKKTLAGNTGAYPGLLDKKKLGRFLMHYERLTRWMLEEMPGRADLVFKLSSDHSVETVQVNSVNDK